MAAKILLVEDDRDLRELLTRGLREEGFAVTATIDGKQFLEKVGISEPDVLLIDIGLPDSDGRDLCQAVRARGIQAPVLFLTARDALTDRLSGFNIGGDDYVTKPFAFEEILVRLNALLKRSNHDQTLKVGSLVLDPVSHAVACGENSIPLTPTEFRLLAALAAKSGQAVRRAELIRAAWPHGALVQDNTLDAYLARLRRKLRSLPEAPQITTVHGVGYSL